MGCGSSTLAKNNALLDAASKGDEVSVNTLLAEGAQVNTRSLLGRFSSLHKAAANGHMVVVMRLLSEPSCVIDIRDSKDRTPLYLAAMAGEYNIVEYLATKGASVHITRKKHQYTPLHEVVQFASLRAMTLSIEQRKGFVGVVQWDDAMGNASDEKNYQRTFELAVMKGYTKDKKAESIESAAGIQQFSKICSAGYLDTRRLYGDRYIQTARALLRHGADVNACDAHKMTPLMHAVLFSAGYDLFSLLVDGGVDINATMEGGATPLHLAVVADNDSIFYSLLQKGADNKAEAEGIPVLHYAAILNRDACLIHLIEHNKPDLAQKCSSYGITALAYAVESNHWQCAQALLTRRKGRDIGVLEVMPLIHRNGKQLHTTVLCQAINKGHLETVRLLLENGSDLGHIMSDGASVIAFAADQQQWDMVKLILETGKKSKGKDIKLNHFQKEENCDEGVDPPLLSAAWCGNMAVVQLLLDAGADPNLSGYEGVTPVMAAAGKGHGEIVNVLIKNGAILDALNQYGNTALITAVVCGHLHIADMLLSSGKDVNINAVNKYGNNALQHAKPKSAALATKMIQAGAIESMEFAPPPAAENAAPAPQSNQQGSFAQFTAGMRFADLLSSIMGG